MGGRQPELRVNLGHPQYDKPRQCHQQRLSKCGQTWTGSITISWAPIRNTNTQLTSYLPNQKLSTEALQMIGMYLGLHAAHCVKTEHVYHGSHLPGVVTEHLRCWEATVMSLAHTVNGYSQGRTDEPHPWVLYLFYRAQRKYSLGDFPCGVI